MKVIPLSEGSFSIDKTKKFIPFNAETDSLKDRPGSILVEIQPFLVITSQDVILLDGGLGFRGKDGTLQLYQNLLNNGIGPMEVTKVLISHLHKDHTGALMQKDEQLKQYFLSFPNATYYVYASEIDWANDKAHNPSYFPNHFDFFKSSDSVELLTEPSGMIDGYIHYEHTGGHSPHHIAFWIKDDDETVFYGGDEAPQLSQMKSKIIAKYDANGKIAMELRSKWLEQGSKEKWTFLFYHDSKTPTHIFKQVI